MAILFSSGLELNGDAVIMYPQDRSAVRQTVLNIVLSVDAAGFERISALNTRTGLKSCLPATEKSAEMGNYPHLSVTLEPGENVIEISIERSGMEAGEFRLDVYRTESASYSASLIPVYKVVEFHGEEVSQLCTQCHQLEPPASDTLPSTISQSTCHPCHKRVVSGEYIHGPNAKFQCLTCHRPTASGFEIAAVGDTLCFLCHLEERPKF